MTFIFSDLAEDLHQTINKMGEDRFVGYQAFSSENLQAQENNEIIANDNAQVRLQAA